MLRGLVQAGSLCTLCMYAYLFEHVYLIHIYLYVCPHLPIFVDYMIYDRNELSQQNMFKQTVTVSRQKIKIVFFTQRFGIMWTLFLLLGLNISHLYRPGRFLGTKSEGLWTDGASGIQIRGTTGELGLKMGDGCIPNGNNSNNKSFRIATTNNTELGYMIVSFDAAI